MYDDQDDAVLEQLSLGSFEVETAALPCVPCLLTPLL